MHDDMQSIDEKNNSKYVYEYANDKIKKAKCMLYYGHQTPHFTVESFKNSQNVHSLFETTNQALIIMACSIQASFRTFPAEALDLWNFALKYFFVY